MDAKGRLGVEEFYLEIKTGIKKLHGLK